MGIAKVQRIIFIVLLCPMYLLLGCESKDIVPFQNGDYFEYTKLDKGYVNRYQIESKEKGQFKITWRTGADSEPIELIVDRTGR